MRAIRAGFALFVLVACSSGGETVIDGTDAATDARAQSDGASVDASLHDALTDVSSADGATTDDAAIDAGGCSASGGGPSSQSYTTLAVCSGDADCTFVLAGCYCGSQPALGVAKAYAAAAAACQQQSGNLCGLGCANFPGVHTEDNEQSEDGGTVHVRCEKEAGPTGFCRTYL
jgi:hypothetical protein